MLQRDALEASPLADLHELANEVGLEGFRRLRKADLIDRLLGAAGGAPASAAKKTDDDDDASEAPARSRRSRRGRGSRSEESGDEERSEGGDRRPEQRDAEGVVEVLPNGTGFLRVNHPENSDDDVYVSAAQVRRCELVTGDKIAGPVRAARRSEKYPSLIRVTTINGTPAEEIAGEGKRFEDLPCTAPTERLALGGDNVTLKAIEWLAPIGRGSRVVLHGAAHAGKTEALKLIAGALKSIDGLELQVVLAGARPEERTAWADAELEPASVSLLGSSLDAQTQAIERAVDQGKRLAQRGADAVVLIDSIAELAPHVARRVLASARNLAEAGSLTIIATAGAPVGGETTLIALSEGAGESRFDLARSSTLKAELLVGPEGAKAIAEAKAKA